MFNASERLGGFHWKRTRRSRRTFFIDRLAPPLHELFLILDLAIDASFQTAE
jgi:hypothetical protein